MNQTHYVDTSSENTRGRSTWPLTVSHICLGTAGLRLDVPVVALSVSQAKTPLPYDPLRAISSVIAASCAETFLLTPRADGNVSTLDSHVGKHPKVLKLLHGSHFISFLKPQHLSCGFPACALLRPIKKHRQVSSGILIPADKQKPSRAEFSVGSCLSDAASVRFPLASTAMLGDFNRTDSRQFVCLRNAGIGPLFASRRGIEDTKTHVGSVVSRARCNSSGI